MIRLHITGASGSGTSTLGRALSEHLGIAQFDTDDFYWQPSDPPYTVKRSAEERLRLL
ncbi:MAG TPA: adenylate kinase, partial [Kiloniellaceae bacterium]|nr:adenylate kinase [Kiloniellaceae bacterium]